MSDDPKQLPAPASAGGDWLLPIIVFFGALVILLVLLQPGQPTASELTLADKAPDTVSVHFVQPQDGAEVESPFTVQFAATGLTVEPAGEVHEGAGHFHILINEPFVPAGEVIPKDATHLHFGDGALQTQLDLAPGTYTLRLQFANGAHVALEGDQYRDQITITVLGGM